MPVGTDQGASTFYTGEAEEAHRPPRGVVRLERRSITSQSHNLCENSLLKKACRSSPR
ncbi:hypothetical protein ACQCVP_05425 [Rossellomorea vietnamensis]